MYSKDILLAHILSLFPEMWYFMRICFISFYNSENSSISPTMVLPNFLPEALPNSNDLPPIISPYEPISNHLSIEITSLTANSFNIQYENQFPQLRKSSR